MTTKQSDDTDTCWVCTGRGCGYIEWQPPIVSSVWHRHINSNSYPMRRCEDHEIAVKPVEIAPKASRKRK